MSKEIFLHQLRIRLSQLPESEIRTRLDYYTEIIEDMIEDGVSEEEAVASFGDVNILAQQIMQETSLSTLVKTTVKPKGGWSTTAIVLLVVGSPLWLPLLFAAVAILFSVYLVIWSLIISLFAIVFAIGVTGVFLLGKAFFLFGTGFPYVIFTVGGGLAMLGLCLLAFLAAKSITMSLVQLTKWIFAQTKNLFIRKDVA